MKTVLPTLIISILFSAIAIAGDRPPLDMKTTARGVNVNDFCSVNAKKRIKELDDLSVGDLQKVDDLKKELNRLNGNKAIVADFLKLRDQYVSSLQEIHSFFRDQSKVNSDSFKDLLKSTLTIEAVSMVGTSNATLEEKCASEKNNSLCEYISSLKEKSNTIIGPLKLSVANFNKAMMQVKETDKDNLQKSLKIVLKSIPDSLAPSVVLKTLMEKAPKFTETLGENTQKELDECLNNNDRACQRLLKNQDNKSKLSKILNLEIDGLHGAFESKKSSLDSMLTGMFATAQSDKKSDATQAAFTDIAKKANDIFKTSESDATLKEIGQSCSDSRDEPQKKCFEILEKLKPYFAEKTAALNLEIDKKSKELAALSSTGGRLGMLQKMRQYVAEKYVRTCKGATAEEVMSPFSPCKPGSRAPASENTALSALNGQVSSIISGLMNTGKISSKRGELGPFARDELKVYQNYCSETSVRELDMSDICADVSTELSAIKNQKESKDWEEFNNKYWVLPSDTNPKGYEVYEKKTNSRIFGEGLSQSVSRIYPTWFSNMNLKYQIDAMENQAMYMKQLNYMYSPTSPWNNFSYFGGSYYTFPTSTNVSNPFSTTAGFNFTK
jgi:hypothetical protein